MESIFTTFLLFLAALTALLTYLIVPYIPAVTLAMVAAVALAAGLWWHWTQFSIDYRLSTWQEQLRGYASYAILLVVILLSYGFYVFAWQGGDLQAWAIQAQESVRNVGRKATSDLLGGTTRALSTASNTLFGSSSSSNAGVAPAVNTGSSRSSNTSIIPNILMG